MLFRSGVRLHSDRFHTGFITVSASGITCRGRQYNIAVFTFSAPEYPEQCGNTVVISAFIPVVRHKEVCGNQVIIPFSRPGLLRQLSFYALLRQIIECILFPIVLKLQSILRWDICNIRTLVNRWEDTHQCCVRFSNFNHAFPRILFQPGRIDFSQSCCIDFSRSGCINFSQLGRTHSYRLKIPSHATLAASGS